MTTPSHNNKDSIRATITKFYSHGMRGCSELSLAELASAWESNCSLTISLSLIRLKFSWVDIFQCCSALSLKRCWEFIKLCQVSLSHWDCLITTGSFMLTPTCSTRLLDRSRRTAAWHSTAASLSYSAGKERYCGQRTSSSLLHTAPLPSHTLAAVNQPAGVVLSWRTAVLDSHLLKPCTHLEFEATFAFTTQSVMEVLIVTFLHIIPSVHHVAIDLPQLPHVMVSLRLHLKNQLCIVTAPSERSCPLLWVWEWRECVIAHHFSDVVMPVLGSKEHSEIFF